MHLPPLPTVIHRSSRPMRRLLRWVLVLASTVLVLLALLFSGLRLALPYMNDHRAELAAWLSQAWGAPVSFAQIDVQLAAYRPQLVLSEVQLGQDGPRLKTLGVSLALWRSLMNARPMIGTLSLDHLSLDVKQSATGQWQVVGAPQKTGESDFSLADLRSHLPDLGSLTIHQARIRLTDASGKNQHSLELNAQARLGAHGWALSGALSVPDFGRTPVEVRAQGRLDEPLETTVFISTNDWRLPVVQKSLRDFGGDSLRASLGGCATQVEGVDCAEGMPLIDHGKLSGAVWLSFIGTRMTQAQTNFSITGLSVSRMARIAGVSSVAELQSSASLDAIQGRLRWGEMADGWRLDVDQLAVQISPNNRLPVQQVHLIHQAGNTWFSADYADLKQLSVWLSTAPLPANYLKLLGDNALSGQAEQVRLHFTGDVLTSGYLQLKHFGNVPGRRDWPVIGGADGQGGLSLALFKQPDGWIAEAHQPELVLALPGQWQEPLAIQSLDGTVYWRDAPSHEAGDSLESRQDGAVFFSPKLSLRSADLHFDGQFRYAPATAWQAQNLDVIGQFGDIPVARIPAYLPRGIMGKDAVQWLDQTLPGKQQTGRVTTGNIAFHGDPSRFPFLHGGGWLSVNFAFDHLRLPFQPGWPVLNDAQGQIAFVNQQFHAALSGGTLEGVPVAGGRVSLFDLNHPELNLAVRTHAPLPNLLRFLGATPLIAPSALKPIKTGGTAALSVDGAIGLDARIPTTVSGRLELQDNTVSIPDAGLNFSALNGALQFTNNRITGSGLTGRFEGAPMQWSVMTSGNGSQQTTQIRLEAPIDPLFMLRRNPATPAAWLAKVTGKTPVSATVSLPHQGKQIELAAQTDLTGVVSGLPAPLNKTAAQAWPVKMKMSFDAGTLQQLDLISADSAGWQIHLLHAANPRPSGSAGNTTASRPASGLELAVNTPTFDWDAWQPLLADAPASSAGSQSADTPLNIHVQTPKFIAAGVDFGAQDIAVQHRNAAYQLEFSGDALAGSLAYRPASAGNPAQLEGQFARLFLPESPTASPDGHSSQPLTDHPPPVRAWNVSQLPAGNIAIQDFRRGAHRWGSLAFKMQPDNSGWAINQLQWQPNADTRFTGRARVNGQGVAQQTVLTLTATGQHFGQTIKQLLGSSPITGGAIDALQLELNWPGSPDSFAMEELNGAGQIRLKSGQVSDVDPGAGRLAGLLSLSALTKRLRLDFSDVLDKGLQFDELNADWVLQHGLLQVVPFELKNASLRMNASGHTNLVDDSLDYRVKVYADVGMLLPIIGTVAGGPLVGGAVLAVQQALKSIDKNPSPTLTYHITGTLNQPIVKSVSPSISEEPAATP